jgi:Tol biopolymer transport system component
MALAGGTRLGPYEIVSLLGAGGMGEVYRARDTRLGREAAVKVLPAELAADPERLARFESEARAASALNHPNIVTIYDVGRQGSIAWMGMELIDGSTLRDVLAEGPLPARRAVMLASQLAGGLARAHEAGIVHRDFKPENVLVTRRGRAKILDFGLARVAGTEVAASSQAPTAGGQTQPGAVLGTVRYMAPEQIRAQPADHRTDIFAFGGVLCEMLTGRRTFQGKTPADLMTAILREDPPELPPGTPPGLERIVKRCLEKSPEERFQSGRDLAFALESLSSVAAAAPGAGMEAGPRRLGARLMPAAAGLLAFALGWFLRPVLETGAPSFSRAVRLTSGPNREFGSALSPDGKWVAYLSDAGGRTDVCVKFLAGGEAANLTASSGLALLNRADVGGLEVSPDGTFIVFGTRPPEAVAGTTAVAMDSWAVPAPLGGPPRKFLSGASGVRFSPDGKRIVYVLPGATRGDALVVADADSGNPKEILKARGGLHAHWPAWSADGKFIDFIYGITSTNMEPSEIYRLPASGGGEPEPLVQTSRRAVYPAPMPDGRGLVYASNIDTADLALWWRPLRRGQPRRITLGVGSYVEPRVSADGRALVATLVDLQQSILVIPVSFDGPISERMLTGGYTGDSDPAVSAEQERLVFSSSRSGSRNLWIAAPDASNPRPLTTGNAIDERPAFSPDGRQVAFVSDRGGQRGIWSVPVDGGPPRRIAVAQVLDTLSWSPDGREIVYAAPAGDLTSLFRVSVAEGRVAPLRTPGAAHCPAWSPHGDLIAYLEPRGAAAGTKLKFVEPSGRSVARELPDGGPNLLNGFLAWSPDGQRLAAMAVSASSPTAVWIFEAAAGWTARNLVSLPGDLRGRGLCWSADGGSVLLGSYRFSSNVVLFTRDH